MDDIFTSVLANADYFILLLFRMAGLVVPSPVFGRVNVPSSVKVGLAVSLTMMAFYYYPAGTAIEYQSLIGFLLVCAGELLLGIAMAFATNMFFALAFTGGQLIDMQIGFGIVNVYDQQNSTQVPMIGNVYNILLLIIFWGVDGHHRLIAMLFGTLKTLPVGHVLMSPAIGTAALEIFCKSFLLGVQVALPVVASGLIIEFCFGALMRTVPQLNMFVVGMPIKLMIGLLLLLITVPAFIAFSGTIFDQMYNAVDQMFGMFYAA